MTWAFLPVLALGFFITAGDRAAAQTASPPSHATSSHEQLRNKVNENVLFLMGGQLGAPFNQLAHDISVVVEDGDNLRVLPVVGGAAIQNIKDVLYLRSIDMALTTQEAMNHLKTTRELGPNLEQRLTYIATLFPNPLQILARGGAKSIKDLAGKKVNFNNKGSATAQFAPVVFKTLGIGVEEFYMSQGDALEKMRRGEIDATICSCPIPVPAFAGLKPDSGMRFVSVPFEGPFKTSYLPASMHNEDYPTLVDKDDTVDTIAASTVLISFNWAKDTARYQRTAKFVDAFFSKFGELQKPPRHPLWKTVNLAATIPGWTRFPAAEEWLKNWRAGQGNETAFKQFMSDQPGKMSPEERDRLFREFVNWRTRQSEGKGGSASPPPRAPAR
jgi:TRAP transporter TAXI family solute receptor